MGRSGNPARAASQDTPATKATMRALSASVDAVQTLEQAGVRGETYLLARSAALGLMTAYAQLVNLPDPRTAITEATT